MSDEQILLEENKHLELTKQIINKEIVYNNFELKEIPKRHREVLQGDTFLVESLMTMAASRIKRLEQISGNPYFGRIDFLADDTHKLAKIYIGKTGIYDTETGIVTVDWRTPICSLYYDHNLGTASYEAPLGLITGELQLKRQIILNDGQIEDVYDTDLISSDELLRPYLSSNADNRMKTIIASIQREQNSIIRRPLKDNLIIQGVAGSGKTTVALHRIAYLIYNENKNYKADQFIVIGPNKYFMNYISSILPDLEAGAVEQYTFQDLAQSVLAEKVNLEDQSQSLKQYLKTGIHDKNLSYKSSLQYMKNLDLFINNYACKAINGNLEIDGIELFSEDYIKRSIFDNRGAYRENAHIFIKNAVSYIKNNSDDIYAKVWDNYKREFISLNNNDPRRQEIIEQSGEAKSQIKTGCDKIVKNYFKNLNIKTLALYKLFINDFDKYCDDQENVDVDSLKKKTLSSISKRTLAYEDLPAVMYLSMKLNGDKECGKFVHVVVDESQDFGLFHFYILKSLFKNSSFSIFGDIAQSIYSYRSITDWESVCSDIFDSKCEIMYLEKSYRTTTEIINTANTVLDGLEINRAKPVIRHGKNVSFINVTGRQTDEYIKTRMMQLQNSQYKSIALICKTEEEAINQYNKLISSGINVTNITDKDNKYNGGLCVLTSYLAKGLEFDAVVISDASEESYSSTSKTDLQLLYVAMTRPLHELDVLYNGTLNTILSNGISNESLNERSPQKTFK